MPRVTLAHVGSPARALTAVVLLSFVAWGSLAHAASVPHFFMDELFYMKSGVSLAQGNGLGYHGQSWGYGPLFPLLVGAVTWLTPDQEVAYEVVKLLNAFVFSVTAVPVYLLARRLLTPWWSVGVAAAAVAIPSASYVSVVMTESLAYMLALWATFAVVLALEQPSASRQALAIGASAAAVATRPEIAAIYVAYVAALVCVVAGSAVLRQRLRRAPLSFWPTALSLVLGLAWLVRPLVEGRPFADSLGSYAVLARSYHALGVLKWFAYHVGDLALYLAVVPMVVAPVVLLACWRRGRAGSERHSAFLALFVAQNAVGIAFVAAFASTPFGLGLLYDRYLFYLVPLWLIVLAVWLQDGMPKPLVALAVGTVVAVASVAALPFSVVSAENWFSQFEAVATEIWGKVGLLAARLPVDSPRAIGVAFALGLAAAVVLLPRRRAWMVVGVVGIVMASNLALSWRSAFVDAADFGASPPGTRSWVDDRVGVHPQVTLLLVSRSCKRHPERISELLTDFFNRSVDATAMIGGEGGTAPDALRIRSDGELVRPSGEPFEARYVVTQPGVELRGTRLATGMATHLRLWEIHGHVRVTNAHSERELSMTRCAP